MNSPRGSSLSFPHIREMQGIHLFHFGLSSCSQRVRLTLEEKGLDWTSHIFDLDKMENVSAAYHKIHPKGYVPALVHDGKLVTESVNIIRYIDRVFPQPQLLPAIEDERSMIDECLRIADEHQWCLKTLTYEMLFKSRGLFSKDDDLSYYLNHQNNVELANFVREFSAGFSEQKIRSCLDQSQKFLQMVNQRVSERPYLAGKEFSLADIAIVVNVHRLKLIELNLTDLPALQAWYTLISDRPSFHRAILDYQPG